MENLNRKHIFNACVMQKPLFNNGMLSLLVLLTFAGFTSCNGQNGEELSAVDSLETTTDTMKLKELTAAEKHVIIDKGTDMPFTGEYTELFKDGTYACRQCDAPLYVSDSKFHSSCGWPSFDQEIEGAVTKTLDADGRRTEITCTKCGGHLGHVFVGEQLTDKNTRHCVNTTSLVFKETDTLKTDTLKETETAIFAGGCFWGVEYYFQNSPGVLSTQVGYTGGLKENPTYKEICAHLTDHYEALEVTYSPAEVSYEELAKLFFEIQQFQVLELIQMLF